MPFLTFYIYYIIFFYKNQKRFLVGMAGLEPAASWSQTTRSTNWPTSRYGVDGRARTYDLSLIRRMRYQLRHIDIPRLFLGDWLKVNSKRIAVWAFSYFLYILYNIFFIFSNKMFRFELRSKRFIVINYHTFKHLWGERGITISRPQGPQPCALPLSYVHRIRLCELSQYFTPVGIT